MVPVNNSLLYFVLTAIMPKNIYGFLQSVIFA